MKGYLVCGVCLAAFLAAPAGAQESAFAGHAYVEVGPTVLLTELEGELDDLLLEDNISLNAITLRGGVGISEYLAIEADIALGTSGENLDETVSVYGIDGGFNGDVDVNYIAGVYLRGHIPVTEDGRLKLFARAGYVTSEIQASGTVTAELDEAPTFTFFDTEFTLPGSYSATRTFTAERSGPVGGGGVEYQLTDTLFIRGEGTYYGLEDAPTVAGTLTVGYRF